MNKVSMVEHALSEHLSQSLNAGARAAQTPYVAFCDGDAQWADDALARAAEILDDHPTIGFIAAMVCSRTGIPDPLSLRLIGSPLSGSIELPGVPVLGHVGCACIVRRQPFLDVGGFDAVSGLGGQMSRLALDFADAGWAVRFAPDVIYRTNESVSQEDALRDDLLASLMRRPVQVIGAKVVRAWHRSRCAVVRAAISAPRALQHRHALSARVEARTRQMEAHRIAEN